MAKTTRRDFLRGTGCGVLAGTAFLNGWNKLSLMNALAQSGGADDYKALVCIFLMGGNDGNNVLIPYDNYADYAAWRAGVPFQVQQSQLLQITPPSAGATFGLHPNLSGLHNLWNQGKLAISVNMGPLVRPITRDEYLSFPALRPTQLFSHSDQQTQHQTAGYTSVDTTGWGGRVADRVLSMETFPITTSVGGVQIYGAGQFTRPLVVLPTAPLGQALQVQGQDVGIDTLLEQARTGPELVRAAGALTEQAVEISRVLDSDPVITTVFPNTDIGNQLKQIARVIRLRSRLGMRRQIFFATLGGFDTHTGQQAGQGLLLTYLSQAMTAFYNFTAIEEDIANKVTTFTLSDFNRTFTPGGGGTGTDHGWGGHQLVLGGDVLGGDFYGQYPRLTVGADDDTDTGMNPRGRWIPRLSVEQYGATLGRWFGLNAGDLGLVFPNLVSFSPTDLGFMRP